jgi:type IV pilus assembly protein PilC
MESELSQFQWWGKDANGTVCNGELAARSLLDARVALFEKQISISKIRRQRRSSSISARRRNRSDSLMVFSRQLASMLNAGMPLVQSLDIIEMSSEQQATRATVSSLRKDVAEGNALYLAMTKFPEMFDRLYVNLVRAGEQSGTLEVMLERIAVYQEKHNATLRKLKKALMYPVTVLLMAGAVTAVLLVKVVPQFASTFADFGAELPIFTRLVLAAADYTAAYGLQVLAATIILLWWTRIFIKSKPDRIRKFEGLLFRLPLFGELMRDACLARFCQTLATTVSAGVALVDAITASGEATGSYTYQDASRLIAQEISQGQSLVSSIRQCGLFPVMIVQLVHAGEQSGTLEIMLDRCASNFELSVNSKVDGLTSLLEPLIMAILGLIIGGLMLAMYLPIFHLGAVL